MNADSQATTKLWPWLTELAAQGPVRVQIRGGCMAPIVSDGDSVDVKRSPFYVPGDILAARTRDGRLVAHRFLGYVPTRRGIALAMQADHSLTADGLVRGDDVLGKVVSQTPASTDRVRAAARFVRLLARAGGSRARKWVRP